MYSILIGSIQQKYTHTFIMADVFLSTSHYRSNVRRLTFLFEAICFSSSFLQAKTCPKYVCTSIRERLCDCIRKHLAYFCAVFVGRRSCSVIFVDFHSCYVPSLKARTVLHTLTSAGWMLCKRCMFSDIVYAVPTHTAKHVAHTNPTMLT